VEIVVFEPLLVLDAEELLELDEQLASKNETIPNTASTFRLRKNPNAIV
jgi:hypothetical protein